MEPDDESSSKTTTRNNSNNNSNTNGNSTTRTRSLGPPSSVRNRKSNPSELFARKQQLLSGSSSTGNDSWTSGKVSSSSPDSSDSYNENHLPRSQSRRATLKHQQQQDSHTSDYHDHTSSSSIRAQSVDTKLESLSELLKNHQSSENYSHNNNEQNNPQNTSDYSLTLGNSNGISNGTNQNLNSSQMQNAKSIEDVYILLAKKEKDLQLAAELGKVLLEKNDELSKANERIAEEYSHKLELLEQDKHKLKRKLDQLEGEYENRLIELQTDCNILKNQLEQQQQVARQSEKEKSKLIDDLVQQNQRLTSELVEATKSEETLSSQLEQMNERFNARLSNRQDHVVQSEALKEEIQIVNQRKQDLERRLKLAQNDKQQLNLALEESGDKILLLENLLNEKDTKLGEILGELNELRDSSSWLSHELETMISLNEKLAGHEDGANQGGGLKDELLAEQSQQKRSQLVEQLKQLRLKNRSRIRASEMFLINRRAERSNGDFSGKKRRLVGRSQGNNRPNNSTGSQQRKNRRHSPDSSNGLSHESEDYGDDCEEDNEDEANGDGRSTSGWSSDELATEIYSLLRKFQSSLQIRKEQFEQQQRQQQANAGKSLQLYSPNSTDDSGISGDDGSVEPAQAKDPAQWRRLLTSLKSLIEEMPCSSCQLMIGERADYEQLQKLQAKLVEEMRRKNDQLLALEMVKTEQTAKVAQLEEKVQLLASDLANCDKPTEEIVKLAWKARDEAVERKNGAEISLAKTRIENMQIASQLMEVVQQKGELSQKLAQFEDDIHYMTQDSVKAKFTWEAYAEKLRKSKTTRNSQDFGMVASTVSGLSRPLAQLLNFSVVSSSSSGSSNHNSNQQQQQSGIVVAPSSSSSSSSSSSPSSPSRISNETNSTTSTMATTTDNSGSQSPKLDSLGREQPASLMRNLTSNRFNLRFWLRSSQPESEAAG